jgi:hypothetical protein
MGEYHNASRAMRAARAVITVAKTPYERLIKRRLITRVDLTSSLLSNELCFRLAFEGQTSHSRTAIQHGNLHHVSTYLEPSTPQPLPHPTGVSSLGFHNNVLLAHARRKLCASTGKVGLPSRIPWYLVRSPFRLASFDQSLSSLSLIAARLVNVLDRATILCLAFVTMSSSHGRASSVFFLDAQDH